MFKRKYYLNEKVFNNLNKYNSYWLGFLWGDGYINNNRLQLCLAYKDYNHLIKFRNFMNSPDINIRKFKSSKYECCEIRFRSWNIYNDLKKYKIILNKSDRGLVPDIFLNSKFRCNFLRGLFDADGCFYIDNRGYLFCEITGNLETVEYIRDVLEMDLGFRCNIVKNGNVFRVRLSAKNTLDFANYIYKYKTSNEYLSRKYIIFSKHLSELREGRLSTKIQKKYKKVTI